MRRGERRRHRCRGVIDCKGRGRYLSASVFPSARNQEPPTNNGQNLRPRPRPRPLSSGVVGGMFMAAEQILADWPRRTGERVGIDLVCLPAVCVEGTHYPFFLFLCLIPFAIVPGHFPPEIARSNVGRDRPRSCWKRPRHGGASWQWAV